MKTISMAAFSTLILLMAAGCTGGENRAVRRSGPAQVPGVGKKVIRDVKVGPPFRLEVNYEPSSGDAPIPVTVEITPTQDLDEAEVTWTLPPQVEMTRGGKKTSVGSRRLRRGGKAAVEAVMKVTRNGPARAVVMVRVKFRGKWYGTAKAIELRPEKTPGPKYKVAPGSGGDSGYVELPTKPLR